jgi:hypothetical protein
VKESRQIYVYITGNADERQQRQNSNTRTEKYFFYLVDLYQACHVLDEANWKWIKWKSDWSMVRNVYFLKIFIDTKNSLRNHPKNILCAVIVLTQAFCF